MKAYPTQAIRNVGIAGQDVYKRQVSSRGEARGTGGSQPP